MRVARILAKSREYANAIAHVVLGTEEFIKSLVLLMENKGFSLRKMKNYKKLFYNHKARHSIISDFFSIWMIGRHLLLVPERKKDESKVLYWVNLLREFSGSLLDVADNYDWWKQADTTKQNCFYVDYENDLQAPSKFKRADYEEAQKQAKRFIMDIRILMIVLLRANETQLKEYHKTFWDADLPDILGESIGK